MKTHGSKIKPLDFMICYMEILETKRPTTFLIQFSYNLSIVVFFGQMLSFLMKLNIDSISDSKLIYISNFFFYMNFSNFLYYFDYYTATIFSLILIHFLTYILPLYIIIKTLLMKRYKHIITNEYIEIFMKFDIYIQTFLIYYNWTIQIVFIEILMNVLDCQWYCYIDNQRDEANCAEIPTIRLAFSILSIIINVFIGFFNIICYKGYEFYVKNETISLKYGDNRFSLIIYILKCLLPICFPFLKHYQSIYFIIYAGIIVFSFMDFFLEFPFRDIKLNITYMSSLFVFTSVIISFFFWKYAAGIILQESLFYIGIIACVLAIKLAYSLCNTNYYKILIKEFSEITSLSYVSEEVFILQNNWEISRLDRMLCLGIMKKHAKSCTYPECKLRTKHLKAFAHQEEIFARLILFIIQSFSLKLKAIIRKSEGAQYFEMLMMKYITFLINSHINVLKGYYEVQKIKTSQTKAYSIYFRIIYKILKKSIKQKIKKAEIERSLKLNSLMQNEVKVTEFFKMDQEKRHLEYKLKNLLIEKQQFWERFKDGFKSYEDLIKYIYRLIEKINNFKELLINSQTKGLIPLKFQSILHSILLNSINEAIRYEDEIDNFKKRCFNVDKQVLTNLSFFNKELAVCQVSFLNIKGLILEASKTPKLASIFGYQLIDLKNIKYITHFMPFCIASKHDHLIMRSLDKNQQDAVNTKKQIVSFAINKKGFILKIRSFFSQSFQYESDFVMNAGIMKLEEKGNRQSIIFDRDGMIQGMDEQFYEFLSKECDTQIDNLDYNLFNIFPLIPKIKELAVNMISERSNQILRNETSIMLLPTNMKDIIDKLKNRKKEGDLSDHTNSHSFSKNTINSMRSAKNKPSRGTTANNNISISNNNLHDMLHQTLISKVMNTEQLIAQMMTEPKKYKINYDLSIYFYNYGKKPDENIIVLHITLLKTMAYKKEVSVMNPEVNATVCNKTVMKKTEVKDEEFSINENPSNFVQLPPDNSVLFRDFGRKVPDGLLAEEETKLNENFLNVIMQSTKTNGSIPMITETKDFNLNTIHESSEDVDISKDKSYNPDKKTQKIDEDFTLSNEMPLTTERLDLPDLLEKQSQKASSVTSMKKTFGIFSTIKLIQSKFPLSIKNICVFSCFELMIVAIYCITLYYLSITYISNNYEPLQKSMINFCRSSVDFNFGVLSIMEYEYWVNGLNTLKVNGSLWKEYNHIISEGVIEGNNVLYDEMSKPDMFAYQTMLKNLNTTFIDYLSKQAENLTYFDMFSFFMSVLNDFNNSTSTDIANSLDYINILQRNYYYFYQINNNIISSIQSDFLNSNNSVTQSFQSIMIVLISIAAAFGFLKFTQFTLYNRRIMKILNILLRMQAAQIFNELNLYKEMIKLFDDPFDSYLNTYFSEQSLNVNKLTSEDTKQAVRLYENSSEKIKKKLKDPRSNVKSIKKISLSNIKPLSRIRPLIYISLIFFILFALLYSNFYIWSTTNSSINDLIDININFNKLYYYSAFLLMAQNLMMREKVIRDTIYENSGIPTQTSASRLSSFNKSYIRRLSDFDTFVANISKYAIPIQSDVNSAEYDNILEGDLCHVLNTTNMINAYEYSFCLTALNNAFRQGLPGLLNQYRTTLNSFKNFTDLIDSKDKSGTLRQTNDIKNYLKNKTTSLDANLGGYLVCKSVLIFYNDINQYYDNQLNAKINVFLVFLLTTSCFSFVFFAILIYFVLKFLKKIYNNMASSLMLIPYEKLINDEQISFLIKQIAKDR